MKIIDLFFNILLKYKVIITIIAVIILNKFYLLDISEIKNIKQIKRFP